MFNRKKKIYAEVLDNMTSGVYLVDKDRKIEFWNRAAESMTGLLSRDLVGSSVDGKNIVYEDESGKILQPFEYPFTLCFQEEKVITKNLFIKTSGDGKIPVIVHASPVFSNSTITGVVVTFSDISGCIAEITQQVKTERKERLIPICGWCKKIRSDENYWEQLETFLTNEGFGVFTHGMCPTCAEKIFEKKVYLESYQNICKEISASISLDEVLQLIVTNVVKVMSVKASLVRLLNKETKELEIAAHYGLSDKYADKGPVSYDQSIDDAMEGKSVSVYDITEHEDARYYREAIEEGIRSILSIPLRFEKEVIGVLRMYTAEPVKYTDDDLKFISALSEQAGIAIVNARRFETAVSHEKEYLRVFEEVVKALSSTLDVDEVLNLIVKKIPEAMGLKGCSLRLLDKNRQQLELAAYFGLSEKYALKGPVPYDKSIDDAKAGKAVSVYAISDHQDSMYYKEVVAEGIESILSIPMRYRNEVIGVLRLYTGEPIKCRDEDRRFMSAIAEQTAIAIVNAKRFESEISKEKEYLRVFEQLTKEISSTLNLNKVLNMVVTEIPKVMNLKAATIRLLDHTGDKLILAASYGLSEKYLERGPIDAEGNVQAALNEKPVAIYDVTTDSRIQYRREAEDEGIKSILTLPIVARGKVIGILRLLTGEHREFTRQEIDFAASLAGQSGIAIENATMYEKSKKDYNDIMRYLDGAVLEKE